MLTFGCSFLNYIKVKWNFSFYRIFQNKSLKKHFDTLKYVNLMSIDRIAFFFCLLLVSRTRQLSCTNPVSFSKERYLKNLNF